MQLQVHAQAHLLAQYLKRRLIWSIFNKLVLDEEKIPPELDVFRLTGRTTMVIVSQVVKYTIVGAGMTAACFTGQRITIDSGQPYWIFARTDR